MTRFTSAGGAEVWPHVGARGHGARVDWMVDHVAGYLESGGLKGHIVDFTAVGGLAFTTCLLLENVGRKSGKRHIVALIYGCVGGEVIIIASKGGADVPPAWYLNITASPEVAFQIGGQAFRATWRELQGTERDEIWAFMKKVYPPYEEYQAGTGRQIPLVALQATNEIDRFSA
ncbi:nitroreductase/quinone reductase family protein [Arthrobacter sp. OV608]|uniref:nitroreductase/quinone reductase family protein n=1 Tax=Arthrobacter sp. OV608 TaxID=1882768 RepID=UPI0008CD49D9|nr:nitroreductase/quinone reductase family protein [Arthrobacter sp. OV608]SEQ96665.1 deazaflavin-dependent oxidoreductase, nitroreductase family [Arthrobacter sp. OV608]